MLMILQEMQQKISTDVDMVVKSDDNEGTDHSDDTLKGMIVKLEH